MVVDALVVEELGPRRGINILAAILLPLDVELLRALAQHARLAERTDVQADAVVDVGFPPERLVAQLLPADEDIERLFALQNLLEFPFERQRRIKAIEERLAELEQEMADCEGGDYVKLGELYDSRERLEEELLTLYEEEDG